MECLLLIKYRLLNSVLYSKYLKTNLKSNKFNSNQITDAYFVVKKRVSYRVTEMFEAKKIYYPVSYLKQCCNFLAMHFKNYANKEH